MNYISKNSATIRSETDKSGIYKYITTPDENYILVGKDNDEILVYSEPTQLNYSSKNSASLSYLSKS